MPHITRVPKRSPLTTRPSAGLLHDSYGRGLQSFVTAKTDKFCCIIVDRINDTQWVRKGKLQCWLSNSRNNHDAISLLPPQKCSCPNTYRGQFKACIPCSVPFSLLHHLYNFGEAHVGC